MILDAIADVRTGDKGGTTGTTRRAGRTTRWSAR
jgi:hypothetical protein